jgi:hypothetical protein
LIIEYIFITFFYKMEFSNLFDVRNDLNSIILESVVFIFYFICKGS